MQYSSSWDQKKTLANLTGMAETWREALWDFVVRKSVFLNNFQNVPFLVRVKQKANAKSYFYHRSYVDHGVANIAMNICFVCLPFYGWNFPQLLLPPGIHTVLSATVEKQQRRVEWGEERHDFAQSREWHFESQSVHCSLLPKDTASSHKHNTW